LRQKKKSRKIAGSERCDYAVAVETSPSGADVWYEGDPYRFSTIVRASGPSEAMGAWRRQHREDEVDIIVSQNPAYVDVVRMRRSPRMPC